MKRVVTVIRVCRWGSGINPLHYSPAGERCTEEAQARALCPDHYLRWRNLEPQWHKMTMTDDDEREVA